ncbi:mechanosensitive ion channel domain-containing protein, partial [Klebsiella pneumoniae]|uniref:mechanosensitive ion channel domain-containing protein n=1 Tax=Klebsiella pneumoniae TaxID=573 RepID=UPI0013C2F547
KLAQKSGKKEVVNLIIKILYFVIIIIALLYILAQLGFNISAIIASLGTGGLAVALAAKDIIANFFASILLLFDNSFNHGDWVEVSGIEGTVVETGLRKTTIRTFDNCLVFLPNSTIMGANIKNWSKRRMG